MIIFVGYLVGVGAGLGLIILLSAIWFNVAMVLEDPFWLPGAEERGLDEEYDSEEIASLRKRTILIALFQTLILGLICYAVYGLLLPWIGSFI